MKGPFAAPFCATLLKAPLALFGGPRTKPTLWPLFLATGNKTRAAEARHRSRNRLPKAGEVLKQGHYEGTQDAGTCPAASKIPP